MATVTVEPAAPISLTSAANVVVEAADQNDTGAPDPDTYPVQAEIQYYLSFEDSVLGELGRSYVFGVDEDGGHTFASYIFPSAGSWTVHLRNAGSDASVANSGSVTVS